MKKQNIDKWKAIMERYEMDRYEIDNLVSDSGYTEFKLPIMTKLTAQTIGLDLVEVKPIGSTTVPGKSDKQKLLESRTNKLRKLQGEEPNVVLPDDILITVPGMPTGHIFYLDYVWSSGNTQNNI